MGILTRKSTIIISVFFILLINCKPKGNEKKIIAQKYFEKATILYNERNVLYRYSDTIRYLKMINLLDSAITLDSNNNDYYLKKSELLSNLELHKAALNTLEGSLTTNTDIDILIRKGMLCEKLNSKDSSVFYYRLGLSELNLKRKTNQEKSKYLLLLLLVNDPSFSLEFSDVQKELKNDMEFEMYFTFIRERSRSELIDYYINGGKEKSKFSL
jgi:hypothetical protein